MGRIGTKGGSGWGGSEGAISLFRENTWVEGRQAYRQLLFVVYVAMRNSVGHQPTRNKSS